MNNNREKYIWIIICFMSTFFTFAMSHDAINYLLVGIMSFTPFLLFIQFPNLRKSELLIYSLFGLMVLSATRHLNTFRLSTILYSLMYFSTFIYYWRLINKIPLTIITYFKIIKFLIWAFFVTMLIQQLCAIINIPIFNYRVGDLSTFKVNSLASEPSYFGKIITVLMISYISVKEIILGRIYNLRLDVKDDKSIWIIFLYQMLLCGSSFALILLLVFLVKYIKIKLKTFFSILAFTTIILIIIKSVDLIPIQRVSKIAQAILTLDAANIFDADQSGAFRIVPTILYIKQVNLSNLDFWFGAGVDFTRSTMPTLMPALDENGFSVGLFPAFIWDFGIITTILLVWFVIKFAIDKRHPIDFLLWCIIILDAPFNTQLFWITIILMSTNKLLQGKYLFNQQTAIPSKNSSLLCVE